METQHTSWQNLWFPLKIPPLNHSNDLFYLGKGQEIATRRVLPWPGIATASTPGAQCIRDVMDATSQRRRLEVLSG